jgi:hypothetical protein
MRFLEIELFIVVNIFIFMVLVSVVVRLVSGGVATTVAWACSKYFEEKKKFLEGLSDVPEVQGKVGKFN